MERKMNHRLIVVGGLLEVTAQVQALHTGVFLIDDRQAVCTVVVSAIGEDRVLPPLRTHMSWLPRSVTVQQGATTTRRPPGFQLKRHSLGGTAEVVVTTYLGVVDPAFELHGVTLVDFWLNPSALS
jgi:hypothetical protein